MYRKKIAVIGSGITGLASAWLLHKPYDVTLFEKNAYIGGHTHTIDVPEQDRQIPVDTGFIVYNDRNYPNLIGLFAQLGIPTRDTDMSFGFSLNQGELEYSGSSLNTLFAQRKNLFRLSHWRLLKEIMRTPFSGTGKPEPLRHALSGYWSRRIDGEHRLVYKAVADEILIAQARYHY